MKKDKKEYERLDAQNGLVENKKLVNCIVRKLPQVTA